MMLNDLKVIGNLTSDPEIRHTPKGTPVANFCLAINETYRVEDEQKKITTFLDVQVWGGSAENLGRMVSRGEQLLVEGSLRQDRWEDAATGETRSKLYLKADRWRFTQYRPKDKTEAPEASQETPAPAAAPKASKRKASSAAA